MLLLIAGIIPEEDIPMVLNLWDMDWLAFIHYCKAVEKGLKRIGKSHRL